MKWGYEMQNEALKKIADLLKAFNDTFELKANVIDDDDQDQYVELKISQSKNNGAEFIRSLHETFNNIVQLASNDHEVIYHQGKGLVVAKKVVKKIEKVDYEFEDFN